MDTKAEVLEEATKLAATLPARLRAAFGALVTFGSEDDIEDAAKEIAKIAAKAMRRRSAP